MVAVDPPSTASVEPTSEHLCAQGHAYAVAGQDEQAREMLGRLEARSRERYVSSFDMAVIHAGLGETDRTFERLDRALEERAYGLVLIQVDPRLDPLRDDPRFRRLDERVGL